MVTFQLIEPSDTDRLYPVLKGVIAEIQGRQPESIDWAPEDLMRQLLGGNSRLVLLSENEQCQGWFVFRIIVHEITRKPTSQIWLFGLFPEYRKGIKRLRIVVAQIFDWLQDNYKMPLEIISRRRGWERVLKGILNFKYAVYGRTL